MYGFCPICRYPSVVFHLILFILETGLFHYWSICIQHQEQWDSSQQSKFWSTVAPHLYIYNNTWRGIIYENEGNRECKRKWHNWKAPRKVGVYNYWLVSLTNLLRFYSHDIVNKGRLRRMANIRTVFFNSYSVRKDW